MRPMLPVLALLALALPVAAEAQPKLAIGTIRGDASRVRRQILLRLCEAYDCVAASRVTSGERPDPEKMAKAGVVGYLGGAVTGDPGERRLFLSLTTQTSTAARPARVWRLRLTPDGRLRPPAVDRFAAELDEAIQGAATQAAPAPTAPPQKPLPPPPTATAKPPATTSTPPAAQPQPAPKPPAVAEPAPRRREPAQRAPAPERPRGAEGPLRVAGEVGVWVTQRKLSWSGATAGSSGSLRSYDAKAVFVPSFRLEAYPGAWTGAGPLVAGIGGYVQYGTSVGLKVKPPSSVPGGNRGGKLTDLEAGVLWRLQPISGSRFVVAPALAYRSLQVTTGGDEIPGLADTKPSGFELRVDAEIPVNPQLKLLAGGGYTMWTSKKDIVGTVFDKGSARGFDLGAGAAYRFWGPLSAKALFEYESISYSGLKDPQTTLGDATGAKDGYLGARIMLRAEY